MPAPACAWADWWPGTGDNGEGDEAMSAAGPGARGRVDTGLVLWLCRRLGTGTMERLSGGRGQTGARWRWSLETSEWPGSPAVRDGQGKLIGDCARCYCYFERSSAQGWAMPMLGLACISCSGAPSTTGDASVLGGLGADQGQQERQVQSSRQSLGVAWRDARPMQVRSGLGGRAAWDLGAAVVDR